MQNEFNEAVAGSYYSLGDTSSNLKVIFMHGQANNAQALKGSATTLSGFLPQAEIIVPNGDYKIPMNTIPPEVRQEMPEGHIAYTWYPSTKDQELGEQSLSSLVDSLKANPENRIHMLGFSLGGFRAAEELLKDPNTFKSAVLHSSAIVSAPKTIERQSALGQGSPDRLLTILGCKDPYLRQKWALALIPLHFKNQWKANRAGIKGKTKFVWDLRHEIQERTLKLSADHIQSADIAFDH